MHLDHCVLPSETIFAAACFCGTNQTNKYSTADLRKTIQQMALTRHYVFMENCWHYQKRLSRSSSILSKTVLRNNQQTWMQDVFSQEEDYEVRDCNQD